MKRIYLLVLLLSSLTSFAQNKCAGKHRIFDVPQGKVPAIITKLGLAPQFHPLRHLKTVEEMYKNLKGLANDAKYRDEINALFTAIGYNGVNDPDFTIQDVAPAQIPFGAIGMLGGDKHKYYYKLIALTNQPYAKGWKITRNSGDCDMYFMDECGNAFNYINPVQVEERIVYREKEVIKEVPKIIEKCTGSAKAKVKVYARYCAKDECAMNEDGYDRCNPKMVAIDALITEDMIAPIPYTGPNAKPVVKNVYLNVDKATFKKLTNHKGHNCGGECDLDCGGGCEQKGTGCCDEDKPGCDDKHDAGCGKDADCEKGCSSGKHKK